VFLCGSRELNHFLTALPLHLFITLWSSTLCLNVVVVVVVVVMVCPGVAFLMGRHDVDWHTHRRRDISQQLAEYRPIYRQIVVGIDIERRWRCCGAVVECEHCRRHWWLSGQRTVNRARLLMYGDTQVSATPRILFIDVR
jgi:hypothetical protein